MVEVSVVVSDGHGHGVRDLAIDDFSIEDEGKPQKIRVFTPPEPASRTADGGQPRSASNHVRTAVTMVLLEAVNQSPGLFGFTRDQLLKWLASLPDGNRVGIVAAGNQLRVIQSVTTDRDALIASLKAYKPDFDVQLAALRLPRPVDATGPHDSFDVLRRNWNDYRDSRRVKLTVNAIGRVAAYLRRFEGRKNLIWVTNDVPLATPGTRANHAFLEDSERAMQALSDAAIALYPINPRGLSMRRDPNDENEGKMLYLARATGGAATFQKNDLVTVFSNVVAESERAYTLAFYPDHGKWNGQFRSLRVKVRRPGVQVRSRGGYVAAPDEAAPPPDVSLMKGSIEEAIASSQQFYGIGLQAQTRKEPQRIRVVITIDAHDLTLAQKDGSWTGSLDLLVAAGNSKARSFNGQPVGVKLVWKPDVYAAVMRDGLVLERSVPASPGADQIRVAVRDRSSALAGSLVLRLDEE